MLTDMSLFFSFLLSAFIGMLATLACIYLLTPVAQHIGLVDMPGGRKMHVHPVPLIGGIAIFIGFCFGLLCFNMSLHNYRGLLAGGVILVLLGVMDDFKELTPRIRLIGQTLAALALVHWGHLTVNQLGNLFFIGNIHLGFFSVPITLLCVLGFINAINMIDGHDGLAGLIVLGQALLFSFLNFYLQQPYNSYLLLIFSAVLCIFLAFNLPSPLRSRASIFMGDAGSTFTGFVVAWFAVSTAHAMLHQLPHQLFYTSFNPVTILWILAYPVFDLLTVVLHRVRTKRSPLEGGRDHLHHLLLGMGLQRTTVTFLLFLFSFLLGVTGIVLAKQNISEPQQMLSFLAVFATYILITSVLQKCVSCV